MFQFHLSLQMELDHRSPSVPAPGVYQWLWFYCSTHGFVELQSFLCRVEVGSELVHQNRKRTDLIWQSRGNLWTTWQPAVTHIYTHQHTQCWRKSSDWFHLEKVSFSSTTSRSYWSHVLGGTCTLEVPHCKNIPPPHFKYMLTVWAQTEPSLLWLPNITRTLSTVKDQVFSHQVRPSAEVPAQWHPHCMWQLWSWGFLHLGSNVFRQRLDPLFHVVSQTVNLPSNKVQPVPLLLPVLQAADPVKGQRSETGRGTLSLSQIYFHVSHVNTAEPLWWKSAECTVTADQLFSQILPYPQNLGLFVLVVQLLSCYWLSFGFLSGRTPETGLGVKRLKSLTSCQRRRCWWRPSQLWWPQWSATLSLCAAQTWSSLQTGRWTPAGAEVFHSHSSPQPDQDRTWTEDL